MEGQRERKVTRNGGKAGVGRLLLKERDHTSSFSLLNVQPVTCSVPDSMGLCLEETVQR